MRTEHPSEPIEDVAEHCVSDVDDPDGFASPTRCRSARAVPVARAVEVPIAARHDCAGVSVVIGVDDVASCRVGEGVRCPPGQIERDGVIELSIDVNEELFAVIVVGDDQCAVRNAEARAKPFGAV